MGLRQRVAVLPSRLSASRAAPTSIAAPTGRSGRRGGRTHHELSDAFVAAAATCRLPCSPPTTTAYRRLASVGCRPLSAAASGIARPSCTWASTRRRNLDVRTGASATRVVFEGRRTVGVRTSIGGPSTQARASREVVVSVARRTTPRLLMASGCRSRRAPPRARHRGRVRRPGSGRESPGRSHADHDVERRRPDAEPLAHPVGIRDTGHGLDFLVVAAVRPLRPLPTPWRSRSFMTPAPAGRRTSVCATRDDRREHRRESRRDVRHGWRAPSERVEASAPRRCCR